jgi:opacity protein-like surface antigen
MKSGYIFILIVVSALAGNLAAQDKAPKPTNKDTSYISIAPESVLNMLKKGKAPVVTLQLSFDYDIGHMDLAGNENAYFRRADFESGATFGTRYGYGVSLTGKISLHKAGNMRLNITTGYNRFQSSFVIGESPEGEVSYNVFSAAIGIEDNFMPTKRFKPFIGLDIVASFISGDALLKNESGETPLDIKSASRFGLRFNLGFEYAFSNQVGMNLGYRLTHANIIGKQSKPSTVSNETYLNDDEIDNTQPISYAGWKQFVYSSFYTGINFYFEMKNKK